MSDHRVSHAMVVANNAPAYTWELPIADVMARAGACVQLHIEKFWTKPGKWDHLKNRTTYSQVPSVVVIPRFDCMCMFMVERGFLPPVGHFFSIKHTHSQTGPSSLFYYYYYYYYLCKTINAAWWIRMCVVLVDNVDSLLNNILARIMSVLFSHFRPKSS